MIIDTRLDIKHKELLDIFMKANNLLGVDVIEYIVEIRGRRHMCIRIETRCADSDVALTFMGVRHSGVKNMFDHYLLRCGVPVDALQPASIHRQIQEERETAVNDSFMKNLTKCVKTGTLTKKYENFN